jgi:hypothetical protein
MTIIRSSYTASEKIAVVELAQNTSLANAERVKGVSRSQISRWIKNIDKLKKAKSSNKRVGSGKSALYPEAEHQLKVWILELRKNGIAVSSVSIKSQMKYLLENEFSSNYPGAIEKFQASDKWFRGFLRRHDLALRRKTKISQKLPEQLSDKIIDFHKYIIKMRKKNNYDLGQIGNMDETPIFFDMVGNMTVDLKASKTVHVRTTGNEKNRFTCVLGILSNGVKLPPFVVFKGKRLPKNLPNGIFVYMNEKGWMNEELTKIWIDRVWGNRPNSFDQKSLLVMDSFEGHKTELVKESCRKSKCDLAIIPGGLTSVVQPLDVCVNKPFKDKLRNKWNQWMTCGSASLTKNGNLKRPDYGIMCQWIIDCWNEIPQSLVIESFKKCGISNLMDGSEDNFLYETEDEDNNNDEVVNIEDSSAEESDSEVNN